MHGLQITLSFLIMNKRVTVFSAFVVCITFLIGCNKSNPKVKDDITSNSIVEQKYLFVGTYTRKEGHVDGKAEGVAIYKLGQNSEWVRSSVEKQVVNPSYITLSSDGSYLYSVNETGPGTISAFNIDKTNGSTELINSQSSQGDAPCYVTVDSQNRLAFLVNYMGGIAVYPISKNGGLEDPTSVIYLDGSGPNDRQEASHPHSIILSPDERFAFVADLGTDKIMIYEIDYEKGLLNPASQSFIALNPGSGPRHIEFRAGSNYLYAINELNSTVSVFGYSPDSGSLKWIQSISTIPEEFSENNQCADIHITSDGKYLYASNRGHNSIVGFEVDLVNGTLSLLGHESTRGDFPRNFLIDDDLLFVANQNTNNIVLFNIGPSGELIYNYEINQRTPVCLKMVEY